MIITNNAGESLTKRFHWYAYGLAVVTAGLLYTMVLLVSHVSRQYLLLLVPSVLVGVLTVLLFKRAAFLRLRETLQAFWGQEINRKREMPMIREFFDSYARSSEGFVIDDRTFQDLNMDAIFPTLDRTMTVFGQQYLYKLLRCPLFKKEPLIARNQLIKAIQQDTELREEVQMILHRMGQAAGGYSASALVWDPPRLQSPPLMWLYRLLFVVAILSPAMFFVSIPAGFMLVAGVYVLNLYLHTREHSRISGHFSSIKYIGRFIYASKKLTELDQPDIADYQGRLKQHLTKLTRYNKVVARVDVESIDLLVMISVYVSIFFLSEVRGFYRGLKIIEEHRKELQELFLVVGELDALQSTASYRTGLPYYCEPTFSQATSVHVSDAYHPLVDNPVANSVTLTSKGLLVTGSNMSGKSTFLRSMGLNALLAQTVFTCYAREYKSSLFQLFTSIGPSDNVIRGESYYLVEAKLILRIINALNNDLPTLCIIDEMYRGTNTEERIMASSRVLQYIARHNCLALAATHDLELTEILETSFVNVHFSEKVGQKGLEFDYKLKAGPARTRNAIALLELLGYPDSIVSSDEEIASLVR